MRNTRDVATKRKPTRGKLDYSVKVHPIVMATAREVMRPGQKLVVVDESTVRLVNA